MNPMLVIPLGLLFLACTVLTLIVLPGLVIAEVTMRKDLSKSSRAAWISALLIAGPLAAAPYACRRGAKLSHRILTGLFFIFIPVGTFGLVQMDSALRELTANMLLASDSVVSVGTLSEPTKTSVGAAIKRVSREADDTSWYSFEQRASLTSLAQVLTLMTDDNSITEQEASEWLALYEGRKTLGARHLQEEVLKRQDF